MTDEKRCVAFFACYKSARHCAGQQLVTDIASAVWDPLVVVAWYMVLASCGVPSFKLNCDFRELSRCTNRLVESSAALWPCKWLIVFMIGLYTMCMQ